MVVTAVEPRSAAAAAGLRAGEQILSIDGREPSPSLDTWGPPGHRVLRPGDRLTLAVTAGDKERQLAWKLGRRRWYRVNISRRSFVEGS
jgi:S1-C subfamily serine protease